MKPDKPTILSPFWTFESVNVRFYARERLTYLVLNSQTHWKMCAKFIVYSLCICSILFYFLKFVYPWSIFWKKFRPKSKTISFQYFYLRLNFYYISYVLNEKIKQKQRNISGKRLEFSILLSNLKKRKILRRGKTVGP